MARYHLILKDKTYLRLLQYGVRENKSMGKILNEIADKFAKTLDADGHMAANPICIVCGRKATREAHGRGQQSFFLCPAHKDLARKMKGWRDLKSE